MCAYIYTLYILPVAILPQGLRLVFRTLCSELLYVQPAAMSVPLQVISINKAEYGFVYTYMGSGIYKCRRCSEFGDKDSEVLWLMKGGDNVWYAFDAPKDPLPTSVPTDDKVILKSYLGCLNENLKKEELCICKFWAPQRDVVGYPTMYAMHCAV